MFDINPSRSRTLASMTSVPNSGDGPVYALVVVALDSTHPALPDLVVVSRGEASQEEEDFTWEHEVYTVPYTGTPELEWYRIAIAEADELRAKTAVPVRPLV